MKTGYAFNREVLLRYKMIVWDDFVPRKCVSLPDPDEVCEERSAGFHSNMSGLSDVSIPLSSEAVDGFSEHEEKELHDTERSAEPKQRESGNFTNMLSDVSAPPDGELIEDDNEELGDFESSQEPAKIPKEKMER